MVAVLALQSGGIFCFGAWSAWGRQSDGDMGRRAAEYALFREGIYPNAWLEPHPAPDATHYTVYPPYAFPLFAFFFEPGGISQGRFLIEALSLASVAVMGLFAYRTLIPYGQPIAWVGALSGAAIAGNVTALIVGQFSIICVGLVIQQWILLERNRPLGAGVCWALAMIKPQIALPFAALFLCKGRMRGVVLGLLLLLGLSLAACWWTDVTPSEVLAHWTGGMSLKFTQTGDGIGLGMVARAVGTNYWMVQAAAIGVLAAFCVAVSAFLRRFGHRGTLPLAGACAVAGMFLCYHLYYDNVMLFPALLATIHAAMTWRTPVARAVAAATLLLLVLHRRLFPNETIHDVAQAIVWGAAAIMPLWALKTVGSPTVGDTHAH